MPLQLLLLLTLLGPGSSLQLWKIWEDEAKESPGSLLARGRRQVAMDEDFDTYEDYNTDAPEILEKSTEAVSLSPKLQALIGTVGQRDSAEAGTLESATLGVATGNSSGLDVGGATIGNLSTGLAMQGIPVTLDPLTKELVTTIPPTMEAPSTELTTTKPPSMGPAAAEALSMKATVMEALSTGPAATEALTTQPAATETLSMKSIVIEALSTGPAATEALTTQPAATESLSTKSTVMEALSTGPAATEALTTQPAATEALSMTSTVMEALSTGPAVTEALSTGLADTAAPSMEPTSTEVPSTDPATTKAQSTRPATTRNLTTPFPVMHPHGGTTESVSNSSEGFTSSWKIRPVLWSSEAPSPTGVPDYIPVKQCLLAILILALLATIFLVCTVVLAVRLSRKNHTYPVRSYSPTEMVCISALLPERGEGPTATANGHLPTTRTGLLEDREGDDLTLHSFLP